MVQEGPGSIGSKLHQHVYIAVRPEVIAQHRAKQGKFGYLPALAKLDNSVFRQYDLWFRHNTPPFTISAEI